MAYDVIIIGAGEGGVSAAEKLGRSGYEVLVIHENDYIGGMIAAGVGMMDGGQGATDTGFYRTFKKRCTWYYNRIDREVNTAYWGYGAGFSCEPVVAKDLLLSYLRESGVNIVYNRIVTSVSVIGQSIQSITTESVFGGDQIVYEADYFLDASDYGDLMRLSGHPFRVGSGTSDAPNYGERVQDITAAAIIERFSSGIDEVDVPFDENEFNSILAENGSTEWGQGYPYGAKVFMQYRWLPVRNGMGNELYGYPTKTGLNWGNDSIQTVDALLDRDVRMFEFKLARQKTLRLWSYLKTILPSSHSFSLASSEGFCTEYNRWIDSDEDACNMPVHPYVRESIRLIGNKTITADDLIRIEQDGKPSDPLWRESLGIARYTIDIHGYEHLADEGLEQHPYEFYVGKGRGYQPIVKDMFIGQFDNFIPASGKLLSVSRAANGVYRHQPVNFIVGEIAASIVMEANGGSVKSVSTFGVQKKLALAKSNIIPFEDVPHDHENYQEIMLMGALGYMQDNSGWNFNPDGAMRRSWIAGIMNEVIGDYSNQDTDQSTITNADLVDYLEQNYSISGYDIDNEDNATRVNFAKYIINTFYND